VEADTLREKERMMYVYKRTEPGLWTVGFYDPKGKWEPESDHSSSDAAAERVRWLNGSPDAKACDGS
jgi:hypothetical protein